MAKKKRTLEKKKLAEIHRSKQFSSQKLYIFSAKTNLKDYKNNHSIETNASTAIIKSDNGYLTHDLKKTIFLTSAIIIIQFILRMFIH